MQGDVSGRKLGKRLREIGDRWEDSNIGKYRRK